MSQENSNLGWGAANNIPLNQVDDITKKSYQPEKVLIHDTTLRDGEQFAGVELTKADKVEIGKALSDYGVHRIEIMPAVSQDDFEATAELNALGLKSEIVGFCRSVQSDIDRAIEAGCKAVVIEIPAGKTVLKGLGWSLEQASGKMIEMVKYAKSQGLRVTVFFVAITDSPLDFIEQFIKTVLAESDPDSIALPDSLSKCLPDAIYHLVRMVKQMTDKPVEIHPHNAFSMGTANALAGVMAGAEVVHTCVNSLGEGTGNASLDTVAVNLNLMLGIDTGVDFKKTYALSKLVEKITRVKLQANWPLSGDRVFTTEAGIAVDIYAKMAKAGVSLPPEHDLALNIGRTRDIAIGKLSGGTSISIKMAKLGLGEVSKEKLFQILDRVKQKSIEKHDTLSDEEFKEIVSVVTQI
jgi:isopropylmalate/homocitrate/citramalate synthase